MKIRINQPGSFNSKPYLRFSNNIVCPSRQFLSYAFKKGKVDFFTSNGLAVFKKGENIFCENEAEVQKLRSEKLEKILVKEVSQFLYIPKKIRRVKEVTFLMKYLMEDLNTNIPQLSVMLNQKCYEIIKFMNLEKDFLCCLKRSEEYKEEVEKLERYLKIVGEYMKLDDTKKQRLFLSWAKGYLNAQLKGWKETKLTALAESFLKSKDRTNIIDMIVPKDSERSVSPLIHVSTEKITEKDMSFGLAFYSGFGGGTLSGVIIPLYRNLVLKKFSIAEEPEYSVTILHGGLLKKSQDGQPDVMVREDGVPNLWARLRQSRAANEELRKISVELREKFPQKLVYFSLKPKWTTFDFSHSDEISCEFFGEIIMRGTKIVVGLNDGFCFVLEVAGDNNVNSIAFEKECNFQGTLSLNSSCVIYGDTGTLRRTLHVFKPGKIETNCFKNKFNFQKSGMKSTKNYLMNIKEDPVNIMMEEDAGGCSKVIWKKKMSCGHGGKRYRMIQIALDYSNVLEGFSVVGTKVGILPVDGSVNFSLESNCGENGKKQKVEIEVEILVLGVNNFEIKTKRRVDSGESVENGRLINLQQRVSKLGCWVKRIYLHLDYRLKWQEIGCGHSLLIVLRKL